MFGNSTGVVLFVFPTLVSLQLFGKAPCLYCFDVNTHRTHGTIVDLLRFLVDFHGKLVDKYISPMDPIGLGSWILKKMLRRIHS